MKKSAFLFLCGGMLLLLGCGDAKTTVSTDNHSAESVGRDLGTASFDTVEDAIDDILTNASASFIGYHPIDESFLLWVSNTCGADSIKAIASATDHTDPDIWYQTTGKSIHVLWWEYSNITGISYYENERIIQKECASEDEVVLDFCGDVSMASDVATTTYMEAQPDGLKDCFSDELLQEMLSADIFVANHEFVSSTRGEPLPGKAFTFRANPAYVSYWNDIGVDLLTLANNHVYDFGEVGLLDTLDTLAGANIPYVGAGRNLDEAMMPIYYIANGKKIAIVDATQIERSYAYTKEATATEPGVLKTLDSTKYVSVIQEAKQHADYCIAVVHWGTEGNALYGADQTALANDFIGAGADAIIGGHTHCLEGIEYIGDVPVYYSLGNYFFSTTGDMPADYDTGLARIRIRMDGEVSYEFVPCAFSSGVVRRMTDPADCRELFDYMESISATSSISDDGVVTKK